MMALFSPFSTEVNTALIALAIAIVVLALVFAAIDFTKVDKAKKQHGQTLFPLELATEPVAKLKVTIPAKLTAPTFNISELSINPVEAKEEETITISFKIANTGDDRGCHNVKVQLDNRMVAEEEVALGPGEISQISCTVTENHAGDHEVRVGGLTAKFVIPNADISVTKLDVNPQRARAGETVTVKVELINKGGVTGVQKVEPTLNGEVIATKEISVAPGKTELVTFDVAGTQAGEHHVEVGGSVVTFVIPDADIRITSLDISPLQAKAGETVTVKAELINKGGTTGTQKLELTLDGKIVAAKDVTVQPEETAVVTFEVVELIIGEHRVKVSDLEATFFVGKADIRITAMDINPRRARAGEPVVIKAELINKGSITDAQKLELAVDGRIVATKEVSVTLDKPQLVTFEVIGTKTGEYKVEMGGLVGSFVIPEADIKINALYIIPRRAKLGEMVVVKAELINEGGVTGNQKLELRLGDAFVAAQEFAVAPGMNQKAIFFLRGLKPGVHHLKINDIGDEFMVYMANNP